LYSIAFVLFQIYGHCGKIITKSPGQSAAVISDVNWPNIFHFLQ